MSTWVNSEKLDGQIGITYDEALITYDEVNIQYDGKTQTVWSEEIKN